MDTNTLGSSTRARLVSFVVALSCLTTGNAEPFRLTPKGVVGNINDGFAVPVTELRRQLDEYWEKGKWSFFFSGGENFCAGLKDRVAEAKDEASVKLYVETCVHVLSHKSKPLQDPYGVLSLVEKKTPLAAMMLRGVYLGYVPAGEYAKTRAAILEAAYSHMNDLREELKATPPEMPPPDLEYRKPGLSWEKQQALADRATKRAQLRLALSTDLHTRKKLPEALERIESNFVEFVEQEYRRVRPEKGEMEKIIERAGLPKEVEARLKLLIPR